jgi:hypothetical protein
MRQSSNILERSKKSKFESEGNEEEIDSDNVCYQYVIPEPFVFSSAVKKRKN